MNKALLKFCLVFILLLAQGCASYSVSIKDAETLNNNDGLLLVYADLRWIGTDREQRPGLELTYRTSLYSLDLKKVHFFKNETMQLVRVPAGDYVLTHGFFGFGLLEFPRLIPFSVKPGQVTYLGHFDGEVTWPKFGLLSDRRLKIIDKSEEANKDFSTHYPKLSSQTQFSNYAIAGYLAKDF